jgi:hypothetical protein
MLPEAFKDLTARLIQQEMNSRTEGLLDRYWDEQNSLAATGIGMPGGRELKAEFDHLARFYRARTDAIWPGMKSALNAFGLKYNKRLQQDLVEYAHELLPEPNPKGPLIPAHVMPSHLTQENIEESVRRDHAMIRYRALTSIEAEIARYCCELRAKKTNVVLGALDAVFKHPIISGAVVAVVSVVLTLWLGR